MYSNIEANVQNENMLTAFIQIQTKKNKAEQKQKTIKMLNNVSR